MHTNLKRTQAKCSWFEFIILLHFLIYDMKYNFALTNAQHIKYNVLQYMF